MLSRRHALALTFALPLLALAVGCEDEKPAKLKTRETLNKYTQDVRELKAELAKGAVLAATNIEVADPLTQSAAAYRTSVAKIGVLAVKQRMAQYEALNDAKPMSYEEFMELIIQKGKPDGAQLAVLPYYQEYAYDADKKELVVVEYPEKKKAMQDQNDKELGRK